MNSRQSFNPLIIIVIIITAATVLSVYFVPGANGRSLWNVLTGNDLPYKEVTAMRLPDGSLYDGRVNRETLIPQGVGRKTTKDSVVYEGEWNSGKLSYGTLRCRAYEYTGAFDEHLNLHGYGIIRYSQRYVDGKKKSGVADSLIVKEYYGLWNKNTKSGVGRAVNADGSMDFGTYVDGELQRPFGADYRIGKRVYGIDISHHQGIVDWDSLALYCNAQGEVFRNYPYTRAYMQPVMFVYIKATEGETKRDKRYWHNVLEARRHGIPNGAYHFLRLGSDVKSQVMNFLMLTKWQKGDLPPVLDVELEDEIAKHGRKKFQEIVLAWLEEVEQRIGVRPIIYTRENIRDLHMKDPRFKNYEFWISRYTTKGPKDGFRWHIWQFSDAGKGAGNTCNFDLNLYGGDYAWFRSHLLGEP